MGLLTFVPLFLLRERAASQAADQDWRDYHSAHQQEDEAHWAAERYRRETEAARFAQAVNDRQQAQQDLQAAQRAQARAVAAGQMPSPAHGPDRGGPPGPGAGPSAPDRTQPSDLALRAAAERQARLDAQAQAARQSQADTAQKAQLAQTRTTIPISDEINCAKCHNGNSNPMLDVLLTHDKNVGTVLLKPTIRVESMLLERRLPLFTPVPI